ncbi:MAG: 30S ribosomal protein S18 [Patescibacteria group bacterium]
MQKRKRSHHSMPTTFSYKNVGVLRRCVTEQGAILPRTETGLSQKQQRHLSIAIKRARHLALLPFTQTL